MDTGDILGWAALIISALALWLGWRSDNAARKLNREILEMHRREAERVDRLIEYIITRQNRVMV